MLYCIIIYIYIIYIYIIYIYILYIYIYKWLYVHSHFYVSRFLSLWGIFGESQLSGLDCSALQGGRTSGRRANKTRLCLPGSHWKHGKHVFARFKVVGGSGDFPASWCFCCGIDVESQGILWCFDGHWMVIQCWFNVDWMKFTGFNVI